MSLLLSTHTHVHIQCLSNLLKGVQNKPLLRHRETWLALAGAHSFILILQTMSELHNTAQQHSTNVGRTFKLSGELPGEVRQASEVEDPQVLPFATHSIRGGRETTPRAGVPADDEHTCKKQSISSPIFNLVRCLILDLLAETKRSQTKIESQRPSLSTMGLL